MFGLVEAGQMRRTAQKLLLVEHDPSEVRSIREMIRNLGNSLFELTHLESLSDAEEHLAGHAVDAILLDLELPGSQGLDAVRSIHAAAPSIPLVLLSPPAGEQTAIQAMQEGAQDYLVKGQIEPRELMRSLRNAVERKIIKEALFEEKERAQVTLDCIGDGVICTDFGGNVTFLNLVAERMTGWSLPDAEGRPIDEIFQIVDPATRAKIPNPMNIAVSLNRTGHLPVNCVLVGRDGNEVFIEDSAAPIHNREGETTGSVIVFRDVSHARALAEQVVHASQHDSLTGLPNRLLLNDRLTQAISLADRHKSRLAVLFMDIDGFKHINDSLGHLTGDKLLQSISKRLRGCIRTPDTVSRQGGDEFIVLLQDVQNPIDIASTVKRVLTAIAETHTVDIHKLHVTASMGVSQYPGDGKDAETLIKNADTAMYQAKGSGRQCFRYFKSAMNAQAVERHSIEEDLRRALQRKEFALHYQPKIDLKSGAIVGAEALIRWNHPTSGLLCPARFIPVAEDSGLIVPIGAWVLFEACKQAKAWLDAGLQAISMAVNVSSVQIGEETFLAELLAIVEESNLDPRSLELEVTESVLMKHAKLAASVLQTLRDRGIQIAIDDFGTGYSSLSYLKEFPLDALKIDQSFIRQLDKDPNGSTLVTAIVAMGRSLNLRVVAEGVETAESLEFLKAQNCDEAQGYYFSRPVPAEAFAKLLSADAIARLYS
jgi:diguanylate cyclase (GGDEF)-like protein/PAS domain S-box-containing protein